MKKYIVKFYGWEEEMQGYNLSQEQTDKLEEAISSGKYESIDSMGMDIEEILGVEFFEGDAFSTSRGNLLNQKILIRYMFMMRMRMSYSRLAWTKWVILKTITEDYDYEGVTQIEFVSLRKVVLKILLFVSSSSKGGLYEFHIESDEVPKPEDFSIVTGA